MAVNGVFEQPTRAQGDHNPQHIQRKDEAARVRAEKYGAEEHIHRQPRPATDEGHDEAGQFAVGLVFQRAGGVNGGHGAAKADHQRQETLAVQADLAHDAVHHQRGARHVARVLQNRHRQVKRSQHRHERHHAAHTCDHAVQQQRRDPRVPQVRHVQQREHPVTDRPFEHGGDPVHKGGADARGELEDEPHRQPENRHSPEGMSGHTVDFVRERFAVGLGALNHPAQRFRDETVAPVGDQRFGVLAGLCGDARGGLVGGDNQVVIARAFQTGAQVLVVFQQLDRQPARAKLAAEDRVGGDARLQRGDLAFHLRPVVHIHLGRGSGAADVRVDVLAQRVQPLVAAADGFHDRHAAQPLGKRGQVKAQPAFVGRVRHVQRQQQRHA